MIFALIALAIFFFMFPPSLLLVALGVLFWAVTSPYPKK